MADNQNTNARRQAEPDQKDDDPFAELARIVGFEDDKKTVVETPAVAEPLNDAAAEEAGPGPLGTETNLEAELMRELEIGVSEDDGGPMEQTALPESTFGTAPDPVAPELPQSTFGTAPEPVTPERPQSSGPNFFDIPAETSPEPAPEPEFVAPSTEYGSSAAGEFAAPDETVTVAAEPVITQVEPAPVPTPASVPAAPARSWPGATTMPIGSAAASLEDELQAAFSALEDSGPAPTESVPAPVSAPVSDVAQPVQPLQESEELASAYRSFDENIEAALPRPPTPIVAENSPVDTPAPEVSMPNVGALDETSLDVNELLLAEMMDVEAEAVDAAAPARDVPFDPSGISDADDIPETMPELDVPQFEAEEIVPAPAADADFGLPLEEELEALASEASAVRTGNDPSESYAYAAGPEESLDDDIDGLSDDFDIMAEADDESLAELDNLDEFAEDSFEEYDDLPLDDDGEFAIDDDLAVPEYDAIVESGSDHSNRRGLIAAAAVVGIVVVGGAGFYWWNSNLSGDAGAGGPRVIAAESDPVKIKPESPGGKTVPNQDLAVYDKVAGTESETPAQQNLVNTTEEPVDVVQRTLNPESLPLEGRGDDAANAAKSEDRLTPGASTENSTGSGSEAGAIAPRKVRTLVVKPDGTIVAREAPSASEQTSGTTTADSSGAGGVTQTENGAAASGTAGTIGDATRTVALAPSNNTTRTVKTVEVTQQPAADSTQVASTTTSQNSASTAITGDDANLPPIDDDLRNSGTVPVPGSKPGGQSTGTQTAAVTDSGSSQTASTAPIPSTRPADQPVAVVEAVNDRGNLAGTRPASNPGGYVVQISSQPSEAGAQQSYRNLARRYASIIGGRGVSYQRADIPNRGVFYRVRIPAGSKAEATSLCNQYKAAGGSCFVAR